MEKVIFIPYKGVRACIYM